MNYESIKTYANHYAVPIMRDKTAELIAYFVKNNQPQHILEIGTAIGYSGVIMLNNSNADLVTIEHNKLYIKKAKQHFKEYKVNNRTTILDGDCLVILANLTNQIKYRNYFDLIFLDGPKAQYGNMLKLLLLLLKENGTLIVDDVLFHKHLNKEGKVSRRFKTIETRLNDFIDKCKKHPEISDFELKEIDDGLIFAKKGQNEKS